ncbi:MAG: hypothetical protein KDI13_02345 [Alphaproteobacteria bacterium]|nr:hypothetical protein [Alphaproteobacteria bacterium]
MPDPLESGKTEELESTETQFLKKASLKDGYFTKVRYRPDDSLLIATLSLGDLQLLDALLLYEDTENNRFYLPLRDVVEALEFPIVMDANGLFAKGWFVSEDNSFELDLQSGEVVIKGETTLLKEGEIERHDDGIYVSLGALEKWFPLTAEFDYNNLAVIIKSLQPFPVEVRMARNQRRQKLQTKEKRGSQENPLAKIEYPLNTVPIIDVNAQTRYNNAPDTARALTTSYTTLASGIVMGQDTHLSINDSTGDSAKPDIRIRMGREDPDGNLLGLGLSDYEFGDINATSIPILARGSSGRGIKFSNQELSNQGNVNFNNVELRGNLPVGYEVDIMKDGQLVGFIEQPDANGEYVFETQASPGLNIFELTFYGPQGQKETKEERIFVPANLVKKDQLNVSVSLLEQNRKVFENRPSANDDTGMNRLHAQFEYGLADATSIYTGIVSAPLDGKRKNYGIVRLTHSYKGVRADLSYARSDGNVGEAFQGALQGIKGSLRWQASHTLYHGLDTEVTRNSGLGGVQRQDTALSVNGLLPYIKNTPFSIKLNHVDNTDGDHKVDWQTRVTKNIGKLRVTTQLDQQFQRSADSKIALSTQMSSRFQNLTLRGTARYELQPESYLSSFNLAADWKYDPKTTLSGGLRYAGGDNPVETLSIGVSHDFDIMKLGFNTNYNSDNELLAILSTSFSLGYDPMAPTVRMEREHKQDAGYFIPRVFFDENENNSFDEGTDQLLEEVTFAGKGIDKKAKTNEGGYTLVSAPSYERSSIAVEASSLDNPFYRSFLPVQDYILRPGQTQRLDFPITMAGEADTQIYAFRNGKQIDAQSIEMQVLSKSGEVISTSKSEFDGFVFLKDIPMGQHEVRPDPKQIESLGYCPAKARTLILNKQEPFVSIEPFSLWPAPDENKYSIVLAEKLSEKAAQSYWGEIRENVALHFMDQAEVPAAYLIEHNKNSATKAQESILFDLVLYHMDQQDAEILCGALNDNEIKCKVTENLYQCPDNVVEIAQMDITQNTSGGAGHPTLDYDMLKDMSEEDIEKIIDN